MEFESLLGVGGSHNGLYAEAAAVLEELLGSAARIDWGTCVISGDRKESKGVLWIRVSVVSDDKDKDKDKDKAGRRETAQRTVETYLRPSGKDNRDTVIGTEAKIWAGCREAKGCDGVAKLCMGKWWPGEACGEDCRLGSRGQTGEE